MSYWSFEQRVSEDDALHYGVLGMKWGVRRYPKYDKTRTRKVLTRHKSAEEVQKRFTTKLKVRSEEKNSTKSLINRHTIYKQLGVVGAAAIALGAAHIKHYYAVKTTTLSQYSDQKRNIMIGAAAIGAILEGNRIYQINRLKK